MKKIFFFCAVIIYSITLFSQGRTTINLNGIWEFDQSLNAFPPVKFTRKCPVPGLIHLATPKVADYDKFFKTPDKVAFKEQQSVYDLNYIPKYSWYKKKIVIAKEMMGKQAVISIKKSQYVTTVYINGFEVGTSMSCYTPIEIPVTQALKYGVENEILIRVGERVWLPAQAAGGTDKEKEHYIPGIWDDVNLSFTGIIKADKVLILPSLKENKIIAKIRLRNFLPMQVLFGESIVDTSNVEITIKEKKSGKTINSASFIAITTRDKNTIFEKTLAIDAPHAWTPEDPFLYTTTVKVTHKNIVSDESTVSFGMRDFGRDGKHFTLNGKKIFLRGTNITLQRFFEDPECSDLAWNRDWVKKLIIDHPKEINWNAMRICVGLVPDFWYELADEYGMLFQNEWFYWQNHGWDDQIRSEYTDWVWNDGNHPSIVIWDGINENWDPYIGNVLIPELKKLDPTRIWDAGFMTGNDMGIDEMDEPHPYRCTPWNISPNDSSNIDNFNLGNLSFWPSSFEKYRESSSAQLVNEYGWIWLWRDGRPAKLTVPQFDYYLGKNSSPEQNREFQAYWMQCETEWLRCERSLAGVLAFCTLTNNWGYTGDWYVGTIKDLEQGPTYKWFRHCFAPTAVFIDLVDQRYLKYPTPYSPGSSLFINMIGINDLENETAGILNIHLLNSEGKKVFTKTMNVSISAYGKKYIPCNITLPSQEDGYLLVAEYSDGTNKPVMSRRYIKVGKRERTYKFYNIKP